MAAVVSVASADVLDSATAQDRALPKQTLAMRSLPLPVTAYEAVVITRQPSKSDPPLPTAQLLQELAAVGALEPQGASGLRRTSTAPSSRTSSSASSTRDRTEKDVTGVGESPAAEAIKRGHDARQEKPGKAADVPPNGFSSSHTLQKDSQHTLRGHPVSSITTDLAALRPPSSPSMHSPTKILSQTRAAAAQRSPDANQKRPLPRSTRQRQSSYNSSAPAYGAHSPRTGNAEFPNWSGGQSALGISNVGHMRGMSPEVAPSSYQFAASPSHLALSNTPHGQIPFVDPSQQFSAPTSPMSSHTFFSPTSSSTYHSPSTATSPDFAASSYAHDSPAEHFADGLAQRQSPPYVAQAMTAPYMTYTHFSALDPMSTQYGQQYVQFATAFQAPDARHYQVSSHPPGPSNQFAAMAYRPGMPLPQAYHALGLPPVAVPGYVVPPMAMGMHNPASPSSIPPPQVYAPPPELARGHLAQARFHDAVYGEHKRGVPSVNRGSALPKPPAHSPYALWVGNVPSDATHAELWAFFNTRPPPSANPKYAHRPVDLDPSVDLNSVGIDSIHLINRSNCAFVNYASAIHLQHAIEVSNGIPLRGFDPRCKDLVCRERKKDEDTKSGVGAQRIGGMHKEFVREKRRRDAQAQATTTSMMDDSDDSPNVEQMNKLHALRHSTSETLRSVSTASTSSSFLRQNFAKRFFVLKSHDESDLQLSVERGIWATQAHNEPILDQAFRTAKDVYLIFSANRTGCFFGVARMASSIHADNTSSSCGSKATNSSRSDESFPPTHSNSLVRPATIKEELAGSASSQESTLLFPEAEDRFTDMSPLPVPDDDAPEARPNGMVSAPPPALDDATLEFAQASRAETLPAAVAVASSLKLPANVSKSEPVVRRQTLDPALLKQDPKSASDGPVGANAVDLQRIAGSSGHDGKVDDDGVWRKDTLPTPAERNARLENIEDKTAEPGSRSLSAGWGKPFKVEWIKV
ncbi:hypothetical protein OIV83_004654 [Microbotryomycetes sp. JL201]|nr:hypothetical protein OIV83_004654 [Microbotryomycetes sp. JL201]